MEEVPDMAAARAAALSARTRLFTSTDEELLSDLDAIEQLGRLVDGLRIQVAAEVEHRSRPILGSASLAFRNGAKDGVQLVEQVARISHRDAARRVGLGAAVGHRRGLLGETLPGRLPALTDAIDAGAIGLDAARVIVDTWKSTHLRATPEGLEAMVESLVEVAQRADVAVVEEIAGEIAGEWRLALDPDGAVPDEKRRRRQRSLRIGDTLEDGTTRVSAVMLPEHLALLREFLQAARRTTPLVRTEAGSDNPDEPLEPEWREDGVDPDSDDPRSRAQQDYDTLAAGLTLAAQAEAAGFQGTTTTHQVVVVATVDDIAKRAGQGWTPGVLAGLPMPTIEQLTCTGETRLQVNGSDGEPLYLSRTHRLFSTAQKVALLTAAGGRCEYPDCATPAPYLEAHHVEWFQRDHGETHTSNGIMLCSYHHHLIHAKDTPVEIRRYDGDLYLVPTAWTGPPAPGHRRRERPTITRGRIRRAAAPWTARLRPDVFLPTASPPG